MKTVEAIIDQLELQPHPEGGYFRETYRSEGEIDQNNLGIEYGGARNFSTCIYFLLTSENFSAFHKINQDEIWHFYEGSAIELHTISESGSHKVHLIGNRIEKGELPQLVVPGNHWFASKVMEKDSYSLVGCTVSPGFNFEDFVLAARKDLEATFPQHKELIEAFTRS